VDRKRKAVLVKNRNGVPCSFPLMSVCIAAITNQHKPYQNLAEIACDAAEVKAYLKTQPGSHYLRDRRTEPMGSMDQTLDMFAGPEEAPLEPKPEKPKPLGQILLDIGLITEAELSQAVRRHVETGERIGQVLVRMNALSSADLGRCLAEKLGIPYISLGEHVLDDELGELLSDKVIRHRHIVPLAVEEGRLVLAMVNPLDRT
jgi:GSPII_E N-terminal domain.